METSRVFGRVAAAADPEMLIRCAPHLCARSYDQAHFDAVSGFVRAREKVSLGSLTLRAGNTVDFAGCNPPAAREVFIREGVAAGAIRHGGKEIDRFNARRAELLEYEIRMRRPGFLYDETRAAEFFLRKLPPEATSVRALRELLRRDPALLDFSPGDMALDEVRFDPADYPDRLEFSGVRFRLFYTFDPGDERDGAMLAVPESELNLLPDTALAYPVPGHYADFAEALLRALPKELRRQLGGIPQCAALFAKELKRDPARKALPPGEVMADFLRDALEIEVDPRRFDEVKLPEYLRLKLAVLNADGRLKCVRHDLPERFRTAAKLTARLPGTERFRQSGWIAWDPAAGTLPEEVESPPGSGRVFHPALTEEPSGQSVGIQLYLKSSEARHAHQRAVARLFGLTYAPLVKAIRRDLRFSNELRLTLMLETPAEEFASELVFAALREHSPCDLWDIRSHAGFATWGETVKVGLSDAVAAMAGELEEFTAEVSAIRRFSRRAGEAGAEIDAHLELLFAPGFLRRPAVWSDYRRYLRALKLRAQRAADSPGRDLQKGEALEAYAERFDAARRTVADLADSPGLYDFWLLLEECRIAVFAPEVRTAIRSPLAKLADAWAKLRF